MDGDIIKPKIGHPCNGCGLCCKMRVCYNGAFVQGLVKELGQTVDGPCPALTKRVDGSYACGIVLNPKKYLKHRPYPADVLSRNFANLIGAGTGCDDLGHGDIDPSEEEAMNKMIEQTKNDPDWVKKTKIALKVIYGYED